MTHSHADSWSDAFMAQQGVTGDFKFTHNTFISQLVAAQSQRTAAGNTAYLGCSAAIFTHTN